MFIIDMFYCLSQALLGAGIMTEMLASLSLKHWKQQQDSRVYTVGSAGEMASSCSCPCLPSWSMHPIRDS